MRSTLTVASALLLTLGLIAAAPSKAPVGPVAISTCQTISQSGSYVLTANLTATGLDCLVVAADNVTLDLAGFVISASGSIGAGIKSDPVVSSHGTAIRNGTITGFDRAVELNFPATLIEAVLVHGNNVGFFLAGPALLIGNAAWDNNTNLGSIGVCVAVNNLGF